MPNDPAREALARLRESIDLEDEDTGVHVHIVPQAPEGDGVVSKLKAAGLAAGTGIGTGIVMALLQHCGH